MSDDIMTTDGDVDADALLERAPQKQPSASQRAAIKSLLIIPADVRAKFSTKPAHIAARIAARGGVQSVGKQNAWKYRACFPHLKGTEKLDPESRDGCKNVILALINDVRTNGMPEELARQLYHEYARLDPSYGKVDRTEVDNDKLFDDMVVWVEANTDSDEGARTIGSVIKAATEEEQAIAA